MMPQHSDVKLLFVPCSPKGSSQQTIEDETQTSWQKHASRQYHRRNKSSKSQLPQPSRAARLAARMTATHREIQPKGYDILELANESEVFKEEDNDPCSPLGDAACDQLDPFGVMIRPDTPKFAVELLQHGVHHMREVFNHSVSTENARNTVLTTSMISPAAFYTLVFSAAAHNTFAQQVSEQNKLLRIKYKGLALSHLQQEISGLNGVVSVTDELLLCMVTLASHNEADASLPPTESQRVKGVLATAQDTRYYGTLTWESAHMNALRALVAARGGLETIISPRVRETIAIADLLDSWKQLQRPFFPPSVGIEEVLSKFYGYHPVLGDSEYYLPKGYLCFQKVPEMHSILRTVRYIQLVTASYNDLEAGEPHAPKLQDVYVACNAVLHEALSCYTIPKSSKHDSTYGSVTPSPVTKMDEVDTGDDTTHDVVFALIRYACLAYIIQVLLPFPRTSGIQVRLTSALLDTLKQFKLLGGWSQYPELSLWIAMLGGTVALGESRFFLANTCLSCLDYCGLDISKITKEKLWDDAIDICKTFLWFDGPESQLQSELQDFRSDLSRVGESSAVTTWSFDTI